MFAKVCTFITNLFLEKSLFIPFSDRFQNDEIRNANDSKLVRFINVTTTFPRERE